MICVSMDSSILELALDEDDKEEKEEESGDRGLNEASGDHVISTRAALTLRARRRTSQ